MRAEVKKKYFICVEIEAGYAAEIVSAMDYFDQIRPDGAIENYYNVFEFQKMLIAKLEEIQKNESGL